jgi:hypothetical protein
LTGRAYKFLNSVKLLSFIRPSFISKHFPN